MLHYHSAIVLVAAFCALQHLPQVRAQECNCERSFKPVCAENGITYNNLCQLQCAGAKQSYLGTCCPYGCQAFKSPVCDSEGRTHENECWFQFHSCVMRKQHGIVVSMAKKGECDLTPKCVQNCSGEFNAVCDSQGSTHRNRCSFDYVNCVLRDQGKHTLQIVHTGACLPTEDLCRRDCPQTRNPVCGSDGNSYVNECLFDVASCQHLNATGKALEMIYLGECLAADAAGRTTPSVAAAAENGSVPVFQLGGGTHSVAATQTTPKGRSNGECEITCDDTSEPVCDTDHQTHQNDCVFRRVQCDYFKRLGKTIDIANFGPCETAPVTPTPSAVLTPDQPQGTKNCSSTRDCSREAPFPICASNGKVFLSQCSFEVAACEALQEGGVLEVVNVGPCTSAPSTPLQPVDSIGLTVPSVPGFPVDGNPCELECPTVLQPVCAGGKTYPSVCALDKENCLSKQAGKAILSLTHNGPCNAPTGTPPVTNPVVAAGQACYLSCPNTNDPVCDSNGLSHANRCMFEYNNCQAKQAGRTTATIVHPGSCGDLPAAPGSTESPPANSRLPFTRRTLQPVTTKVPPLKTTSTVLTEDSCHFSCPPIYSPLCDGQKRTHNSPCEYDREDCMSIVKTGASLGWTHDGPCDARERETIEVNPGSNSCLFNCSNAYEPVCDSNNKTHPNKCMFDYNSCISSQIGQQQLFIAKTGPCDSEAERPRALSGLPTSQQSAQPGRPRSGLSISMAIPQTITECEMNCTNEEEPVCDDQGLTHINSCHFLFQQCIAEKIKGVQIQIIGEGICASERLDKAPSSIANIARVPPSGGVVGDIPNTPKPVVTLPPNIIWSESPTENVSVLVTATEPTQGTSPTCLNVCTPAYEPVCDHLAETHANLCMFNYANCLLLQQSRASGVPSNATQLYLVSYGPCDNSSESDFIPADAIKQCDFGCQKVKDVFPLCTNGNETFQTLCEFNEASCLEERVNGQSLIIAHIGGCMGEASLSHYASVLLSTVDESENNTALSLDNLWQERPTNVDKSTESCVSVCPDDQGPNVCDNRNKTHANLCVFSYHRCTAMQQGYELVLNHVGACTKDSTVFASGQECTWNVDCTLDTPLSLCDSLGHSHRTLCDFRQLDCNARQENGRRLSITQWGPCLSNMSLQ